MAIYQVRGFSKVCKYFHKVPKLFSIGSTLCINAVILECFDLNQKSLRPLFQCVSLHFVYKSSKSVDVLCRYMGVNPVTYASKSKCLKLGKSGAFKFVATDTYVLALPHHTETTVDVADSWSYPDTFQYLKYTDLSINTQKGRIKLMIFPFLIPTDIFKRNPRWETSIKIKE